MTVYHLQHVSVKEYQPQAISVSSLIILGCICELSCSVHTYLLTPWCRVLLEKLTGLQLVKKFCT